VLLTFSLLKIGRLGSVSFTKADRTGSTETRLDGQSTPLARPGLTVLGLIWGTAQERPRVANERPLNDRPLPIIGPPKDGA